MSFDRLGKILNWGIFFVTFFIFGITAQRTVGLWDSGEFIATTYKIQVSHSPGAPLYTLLSKVFTLFFSPSYVAFGVSLFSALCGAFTVFFVFKIITSIASNILLRDKKESNEAANYILIYGSGVIGALSLSFSHSFWVSSTEAEVYTLFTLIASVLLWLIMLWREKQEEKWLFLIAFILGLSLGVHYLGLAMVFPMLLVYIFKRYKLSIKNTVIGFFIGLLVYFFLNNILFYGLIEVATKFELFFVNGLQFPLHIGALIFYVLTLLGLILLVVKSLKSGNKKMYNIAMMSMLFIIGYSTYATSMIRSDEQLPISNDGRDLLKLLSFVKYEQYLSGAKPLIKGHYFNAPLDEKEPFIDGPITYRRNNKNGKYVIANNGVLMKPNFDQEFETIFPRMYNRSPTNINGYNDWVQINGKKVDYQRNGKTLSLIKPTFLENLTFLYKYQLGWLNFRYFLWNFVGTQNTERSSGGVIDGNWASGINWFDKARIGNSTLYPQKYLDNETRNTYYFLPLLLGLLGFIFLLLKDKKIAFAMAALFFMFGPVITVFNNSLPVEIIIRDRDYILLGSFMAFSLCIGLGVLALNKIFKIGKESVYRSSIIILIGMIIPALMGFKGWADHDRSSDTFALDFGKYYLDSCPPNAILITNGDNATFPLYYLQEVENYRTDVRVINFDLLGLDIYKDRLGHKINNSLPIATSINYEKGSTTIEKLTPLVREFPGNKFSKVSDVIDYVTAQDRKVFYNKKKVNTLPTDRFSLSSGLENVSKEFIPSEYGAEFIAPLNWVYSKKFYSKQELILLDILEQNKFKRPVCFAYNGNNKAYLGLNDHMIRRGFINQLLPIQTLKNKKTKELDDVEFNYNFLMNEIRINDDPTPLKGEEKGISSELLRPLYFYLASALEERGKIEKAKEVLAKCLTIMSDEKLPYDKYMFDVARFYYRLGEVEKGRDIVRKILNNIKTDVDIYTSFKPQNVEISRKITFDKMKIFNIINNEMKNMDSKEFILINKDYLDYTDKYLKWEKHTLNTTKRN